MIRAGKVCWPVLIRMICFAFRIFTECVCETFSSLFGFKYFDMKVIFRLEKYNKSIVKIKVSENFIAKKPNLKKVE